MSAAFKFLFASLVLAINTLVLVPSMIPVALVKLALPMQGEAAQEGARAFAEKRKPGWKA